MKSSNISNRSFNLDIARIVALVFIPCLHFFLNTGFYGKTVDSPLMYASYFLRNLFLLGLPMFMLLTGYLQGNKKIPLSKKYFVKITKFIIPYLIITLIYLLVDLLYLKSEYYPEKIVETFTTYINYSWYVEMYLGLFLLIPFLNMTWGCFTEKKHEQIFIGILIVITLLPSFINSFSFGSARWWDSSIFDYWEFIPNWWSKLYPITYYFTGAYLKKHKEDFKFKPWHYLILFFISYIITNAYHIIRDLGNKPSIHGWLYWDSITLYIPAIFLFMFIASINFGNVPVSLRKVAAKISDLCFGALIASKIADMIIYPLINSRVPVIYKTIGFPVIIAIILVISFGISFVADLFYKAGSIIVSYIAKKIKKNKYS